MASWSASFRFCILGLYVVAAVGMRFVVLLIRNRVPVCVSSVLTGFGNCAWISVGVKLHNLNLFSRICGHEWRFEASVAEMLHYWAFDVASIFAWVETLGCNKLLTDWNGGSFLEPLLFWEIARCPHQLGLSAPQTTSLLLVESLINQNAKSI